MSISIHRNICQQQLGEWHNFFKCTHLGNIPSWEIPKLAKILRNSFICAIHDNSFWTSFIFPAIRIRSSGDKTEQNTHTNIHPPRHTHIHDYEIKVDLWMFGEDSSGKLRARERSRSPSVFSQLISEPGPFYSRTKWNYFKAIWGLPQKLILFNQGLSRNAKVLSALR